MADTKVTFVSAGRKLAGTVGLPDGIKPGERVVTAGQNKIDQGSHVTINNSVALQAPDQTSLQ